MQAKDCLIKQSLAFLLIPFPFKEIVLAGINQIILSAIFFSDRPFQT